MKYAFTVVIESNVDSETREQVENCLQYYLSKNCGSMNTPPTFPEWKSETVE